MEKIIIQSSSMILPEGLCRGAVVIENGKISAVCRGDLDKSTDARLYDAGSLYVSPGFIDIHTHGAGGHDFMDGTVEAILGAARAHMEHGTTSLVPTSLTCTDEELFRLYDCFAEAKAAHDGPELLGLHLEGPYFSPAQKGAQDESYLKIPEPSHVSRILDACKDVIRVSAAPELSYGMELGDTLKSRGILASIGHSDADYNCVKDAVRHGYSHVTHLYSGMSSLHREGPYRVLGVVESAYLEDALTVEIIADGVHLPPELLRLILRSKPLDSICLVTDSMRGAGLEEGACVKLGSLEKGQDVILHNGVAMMPQMNAFAGSICTADRCIRTIYRLGMLDMWQTVMLMTRNPARILGLDDRKGALAPGMDADVVIFDEDVNVKLVMTGGKVMLNRL